MSDPAPSALEFQRLRARVRHLEGLITAMDAAHAAFEAAPSPAHELTCALAYAALVEEAARINTRSNTAAPQRDPGGDA